MNPFFPIAYITDIRQREREQQRRVVMAMENGLLSVLSRYDPQKDDESYMKLLHMCVYYSVCMYVDIHSVDNTIPPRNANECVVVLLLLFSQKIHWMWNDVFL